MERIRERLAIVSTQAMAAMAGAGPLANVSVQPWGGSFDDALCMAPDPLDASTMYVVERAGTVRIVRNGAPLPGAFADLGPNGLDILVSSAPEQGLLGMAFSPTFAADRRVYFCFTSNGAAPPTPPGAAGAPNGATIVARFIAPAPASPGDPLRISDASRFDLSFGYDTGALSERWIERPATAHNGGTMNFGPDGLLYIGLGDGGDLAAPQNPASLLGKMLRIDPSVSGADAVGYRIPPNNPFLPAVLPAALAGFDARPQIWAFGLRNPWKHAFDDYGHGRTGALGIADVGQASAEELNVQAPGEGGHNYGWPRFEGNLLQRPQVELAYDEPGTPWRYEAPVHTYTHEDGLAITGGYVYRGRAMCSYKGRCFFADFLGRVWSMRIDDEAASDVVEHPELGLGLISSFGRDHAGELYIVKRDSIFRIVSDDPPFEGDADGDRDVDFADLNVLLSEFGQNGAAGGNGLFGDVNDDGTVNFVDLNIVLSAFGNVC